MNRRAFVHIVHVRLICSLPQVVVTVSIVGLDGQQGTAELPPGDLSPASYRAKCGLPLGGLSPACDIVSQQDVRA